MGAQTLDFQMLDEAVKSLSPRRRKVWTMITNHRIGIINRDIEDKPLTLDAISLSMGYRKPPPPLRIDLRDLVAAGLVSLDGGFYDAPKPVLRIVYYLQQRLRRMNA